MVSAAALPPVLNAMPTAIAVTVLCVAVAAEIVAVPVIILPGGTMTLLAGALIGAGRPAAEVVIPVCAAVIAADQLAYFSGAFIISWWHRRRPEREGTRTPLTRRGRTAKWLAATMPSLAGASDMPYREFAPRLLVMRVPWLAAGLWAGTLAADSLREIGHVAGVVGLIASFLVIGCLALLRWRPRAVRDLARRAGTWVGETFRAAIPARRSRPPR
jgi:membrane protein DedA with SNARE-associated domain